VMSAPLDGGPPRILATSSYPWSLGVVDGTVYWGTEWQSGPGKVYSVPLDGGPPKTVYVDNILGPLTTVSAIGTNASAIVWTIQGSPGGTLYELPVGGQNYFALSPSAYPPTNELALTSTDVYWIATNVQDVGVLMRVDLSGGPAQVVAVIDAGVGSGAGIAVDNDYVYWTGFGFGPTGTVSATPLDGGATIVLASMQQLPSEIAVDQTNLYWINQGYSAQTGSVMELPLPVGTAQPFVLASGVAPEALAIDCQYVYWTDFNGTVSRVAKQFSLDGGGADSGSSLPDSGCPIACVVDGGLFTCVNGHCLTTLAASQSWPYGLAVDSARVYWTNSGSSGSVMSVNLDGSNIATLASGQSAPTLLAIDSTHVYWLVESPGSVMKALLDGGSPSTLASGQAGLGGIAVDSASVYWSNVAAGGTVVRAALDGSGPVALATGQSGAFSMASDSSALYWTANGNSAVISAPLDGGQLFTIASNQATPYYLALDATRVYWSDHNNATIVSALKDGGGFVTLATSAYTPYGVAVDSASVYWAGGENGTVMKVPLDGGAPEVLVSGQGFPIEIAVDATSVYWTNNTTNGTVMKLTPK
jgi:hypothetical protein